MNENLIEERLEVIYLEADKTLSYGVFVNFLIAFVLGCFYGNVLIAMAGGAALAGSFFICKQYISNRTLKTSVLCTLFLLWVALFIVVTNGLLETRYLYFSYVFFFVIYQSVTPIVVATLVGTTFVLAYFLSILFETPLADFMATYLLERQNVSYERFFISLFTLVIGAFSNIWIVRVLREKTINSIKSSLVQDVQIKIFEKNKKFAEEIAKGNLYSEYEEDENDHLGISLNQMRVGLVEASEKQNSDKFINVGIAEISDILRNHVNDLDVLSDKVISKLTKYMHANQGAMFILQNEETEPCLELASCYAYNKKKYHNKTVEIGEGLVGQAYLEQDIIYMTDVPKDYVNITSGLGEALPRNLIIVPLKSNEQVVGIIELASFTIYKDYEIEFLKKVSESIASTITAAKTNQKTNALLKNSKEMTIKMQEQEVYMRENLEELEKAKKKLESQLLEYQQRLEKKENELMKVSSLMHS